MIRLEDPAMLHSLLAVVLSTLATLGFGITFLSLFRYQTLTPTLKLGSALIIGAVIISHALKVLAWLGTTLWVGSVLIVATGFLLLLLKSNKYLEVKPLGSSLSRGLLLPHAIPEKKPIDYIAIFFSSSYCNSLCFSSNGQFDPIVLSVGCIHHMDISFKAMGAK